MELSRIHELNKLAGEFCGKELEEFTDYGFSGKNMWIVKDGTQLEWSPCTDHNQAAEVKATLREKGYKYYMDNYDGPHEWEISDGVHYIKTGEHKDELIALLLAVEALTKKEPS